MQPSTPHPTPAAAPNPAPPLELLAVAALTLLALLPFANKPLHIDDPIYVWVAQHITHHPLDFYGFDANWYGWTMPMHEINANPPLHCYYLACAGSLLGWSETALHIATWPWAVAAALGSYVLARRMCRRPLIAALAAALTPAAVVSSTTIMCDTMLLALWIWAIVFWDRGIRSEKWGWMLASATLIGMAELTKYFGLALIPLLAFYDLVYKKRLSRSLLWLLIPVAIMAAFQLWSWRLYGHGLLGDAARYSLKTKADLHLGPAGSALIALAFLGACLVTPLTLAPLLLRRREAIVAAAVTAALLIAALLIPQSSAARLAGLKELDRDVIFQTAFWIAVGLGVLALLVSEARHWRQPESLVLIAWVLGTLLFASVLNWSLSARILLPLVPAVGILLARRLDRVSPDWTTVHQALAAGGLVVAGALSLTVARADHLFAAGQMRAATEMPALYAQPGSTVWFQGHWGFQHYAQLAGASPTYPDDVRLTTSDHILVSLSISNNFDLPDNQFALIRQESTHYTGPLVSIRPSRACFYSSAWGPIPFAFDASPQDWFWVLQPRKTIKIKRPPSK